MTGCSVRADIFLILFSDNKTGLASGGLDRTVKVWDLNGSNGHMHHHSAYTLHPSFPVRRVLWRPSYECELAIVSNADFGTGSNSSLSTTNLKASLHGREKGSTATTRPSEGGDAVEIWDVRRNIAKWSIYGSTAEGSVTGKPTGTRLSDGFPLPKNSIFLPDIAFGDSHAMWTVHSSGTFSQIDLRDANKPIDAIPRVANSWDVCGSLLFVSDTPMNWEPPYDDL